MSGFCPHGDEDWGGADLCIDGVVYGYCSSEYCGGGCEPYADCDCDCHTTEQGSHE